MCGIFALLGSKENPDEYFKKGSKRGPEFSKLIHCHPNGYSKIN